MKNIQVIDGASNATFSLFQATEEEFTAIFPAPGQDLELVEDLTARLGPRAETILAEIWARPILKRDAQGIHGTLFYDPEHRRPYLPASRREVDWDEASLNPAQRRLYRQYRGD